MNSTCSEHFRLNVHNVRMSSNAYIAHKINASADVRLFNRICVHMQLQTFAIVCLCELTHHRIDI